MPTTLQSLPTLTEQADRLIKLGLHQAGGFSAAELRAAVGEAGSDDALLVINPDRAPASTLAPLLEHSGRHGFVVVDMPDVDGFSATEAASPPAEPVYLVSGLDRGDHLANWSPDDALPAITAAGRTPLTLAEGIHWVLQQPAVLERGHCFMTIGSRLRKADGSLDGEPGRGRLGDPVDAERPLALLGAGNEVPDAVLGGSVCGVNSQGEVADRSLRCSGVDGHPAGKLAQFGDGAEQGSADMIRCGRPRAVVGLWPATPAPRGVVARDRR